MEGKVHRKERRKDEELRAWKTESLSCALTIAPTVYPVIPSSCDKRISSYDLDGRWSTAAKH